MPGILLIFLFFLLFLYVGDNEDDEHSSFSPILEKKDDFRHLLMHFARKPKKTVSAILHLENRNALSPFSAPYVFQEGTAHKMFTFFL